MYISKYDDRYGPKVGGFRYKKFTPPEPLAITILKLTGLGIAFTAASLYSPTFLLNAIKSFLNYKFREAEYLEYLEKKRIQKSLRYLKRKKFIAYPAGGQKEKIRLTKQGRAKLKEIELWNIQVQPVAWDGKWRLVTFDIPDEKESARHIFRRRLKEIGFYHFQKSVFIIPLPCESEINKMKEILDIEPCVHLITADRFDNDSELIKSFKLKN